MPYPVGPVNLYLFQDEDTFDLIDTGPPTEESFSILETALAHIGLGTSRLRNIFLTHGHMDHSGALAALKQKFGGTAFSGSANIPIIKVNILDTFQSRRDVILAGYRRIGFPGPALELLASHFTSSIFRTPSVGAVTELAGGDVVQVEKFTWRH